LGNAHQGAITLFGLPERFEMMTTNTTPLANNGHHRPMGPSGKGRAGGGQALFYSLLVGQLLLAVVQDW